MDHLSTFSEFRPLLFSIAYRMLGCVADAEDLVQETYVRWQKVDLEIVESARAYLTSIVTRLAIDQLKSARAAREVYVGQWLPEPLLGVDEGPGRAAELADSLSTAFLVLLESLSPPERAALLLKDVFDYEYRDIAPVLGKSEVACRQMVRRARERVAARQSRFAVAPQEQERIATKFVEAIDSGDIDSLLKALSEDAAVYSDHGGKVLAAKRTIRGADKVARFFIGIMQRFRPHNLNARVEIVNGGPGIVTAVGDSVYSVVSFEFDGDRIKNIYVVLNPDKLRHAAKAPTA